MKRYDEIWKRASNAIAFVLASLLVVAVVTGWIKNEHVALVSLALAAGVFGVPIFRKGDK